MKEIWKTIKDFPRYSISNLGRIKNNKGKIIMAWSNNSGYSFVHLHNNGVMKNITVHRLVANYFLPNPEKLPEVNHKDLNKSNNNIKNLEWCSKSKNMIHGLKNGSLKSGENSHFSKLTKKQVLEIRSVWTNERGLAAKLSKKYGVHKETIRYAATGKKWRYI